MNRFIVILGVLTVTGQMPTQQPIPTVRVDSLWSAYKENELRADRFYKNRWIIIDGFVSPIVRDEKKNVRFDVLAYAENRYEHIRIRCILAKTNEEQAVYVQAGDHLQVIGICTGKETTGAVESVSGADVSERGHELGESIWIIRLTNCRILRKVLPPEKPYSPGGAGGRPGFSPIDLRDRHR